MGKATLKGLLAHKLRLAATALAIVLGVSFVAGTYVLTDTIKASFDNLFQQVTEGIDVAVRSEETFGGFETGEVRDPMPASLLDRIRQVDGVRVAEGSVTGYAQLVGKDGKAVTTGGAPSLGVSFNADTAFTAGSTIRSGRLPTGPTELAIDAKTAEDTGYQVGDRVKVLFQGPAREFTVSGIIGFGEADNLGGARLVGFELATAQEVLNREGRFDEIDIAAEEGVTPEQLRDRVRAAIDNPKYEVLTGQELAEDTAAQINDTLGRFLGTALLAFAFIALLVGAFLIFNTFTIIVAQRTRELALLRCLGASRRQVMSSVLLESVVVAVVASLVGLGLGVLIANGLKALLSGFLGADIPTTGIVFLPRTVVVALLVGLIVTVLAALMPALKATRVPPVAALQPETAFAPTGFRKRRIVFGVLVTAVGVALLLAGLYRSEGNELLNIASGAVVVFLGVAVLSPLIARPLARVIGWPFARAFRLPGDLARQNAMRSPRRTASTAAALMIGLALVAFVSILAASIKASTTEILEDTVSADYILMNDNFQPFSPEAAERLAEQPELAAVAGMRFAPWKLDGVGKGLQGIDPAAFQQVVRTEVTAGNLDDLASGGLAVRDQVAEANGWTVGTRVPMEFPRTGVEQVPVKAIYKDNSLNGDYLLGLATYERAYADQADSQILIKAAPGVAPADSRAAIDRVMADFPNVTVRDQAEFRDEQARQIDQIINLFYSLLGLAIVIALFGIVNTLGLSIFERIRELGLLRAVGATRGQLRSMIRWEAVIIAVLGAVLGLAVGVFFAWTMVQALTSEGITEFVLPGGQLVLFVVAAGVAGILAAVGPGRRAAKVDVLRAIATE
ncbi:MAG TPA: FtsX-like permease family protein [Actinomycetota bacterium]|jgi:putative ABC transport system permease protein|nr:FtsX-like permease family protein [Actinomycetota bacterium]